jgi:LmbE family N-acetylglucosaminyl deacetylase
MTHTPHGGQRPPRRAFVRGLVGLAVLGTCVAAAWGEVARRRGLYWYDVTADYQVTFTDARMQRLIVRVHDGRFTFPEPAGAWHTALLRVRVAATGAAVWAEPGVAVTVPGEPPCVQHFERSAEGTRFIDLCFDPARLQPGTLVELDGVHLRIQDQDAELLLFESVVREGSRILVLAPHPDDAEIAAFGLLASGDSWIVTTTNGSYGGDAYADLLPAPHSRDSLQAELRKWDSLTGALWAGLAPDRVINLGYFTFSLEPMYRDPAAVVSSSITGSADIAPWRRAPQPFLSAREATSTWSSFVDDLQQILLAVRPDVIVMPHPSLDANRDHVFTAAGLLEALERLGDPPLHLLLYTNHHVHSEYYPFGGPSSRITLPPWLDGCVHFGGVLSHRLAPPTRLAKLFALEAMHDLRPAPQLLAEGNIDRAAHHLAGAVLRLIQDPAHELSYFRRAVRHNELFLTHSSADRTYLQGLVRRAAEGKAAAVDPSSCDDGHDSQVAVR